MNTDKLLSREDLKDIRDLYQRDREAADRTQRAIAQIPQLLDHIEELEALIDLLKAERNLRKQSVVIDPQVLSKPIVDAVAGSTRRIY